ncbi:DNA helicase PriA [Cellulophaga baltica]|uniref:DNA helicase PriA n=1 Tax=Cellulophaga TaxID=104264 RepID=UPI001C0697AF|nr:MULTISPECIES: DNA helicase PriA [Cellulophaga]MBU2995731.1 DNA helicase PriA [Cellulophaga baltica]MDO6767125.1 DNA helicase PriA [Cellulophaga sp. 1_MG-2023]
MEKTFSSENKKSCSNCGAELKFKPGSDQLKCEYCGYEEFIEQAKTSFEELELDHYLKVVGENAYTETIDLLHCKNCGANQHVEENYKSLACIYCSEPLIREDVEKEGWILPGALVPFQLDAKRAKSIFKTWVNGLWFAPNKLKKAALDAEGLHGVYIPHWTFDANLFATYQGQRGDYYYENQRYKTKNGTQTRQVRKTRWSSASGSVDGFIDDILINASEKKQRDLPAKIAKWNLSDLVVFNSNYLSGFVTEKYTISLKDGHHQSFQEAKNIAYSWIKRDIGGDTQRVSNANIKLSDETFKHILVPAYISSYRYSGKEYRFYINGQTGVISGVRPYSFWKIFFLIVFLVIIIGVISIFAQS